MPDIAVPVNEEVHDANALKRWDKVVVERRKLYDKLRRRICRPSDEMVMNSSDVRYLRRTENEMIDQTLPYLSYGKGVKHGDDYWFESSNPALPADSAVRLAKTVRDKGQYPPLEFIGIPNPLMNEIDGSWESEKTTLKYPIMHKKWFNKHPWHIIKPLLSTKAKCTYKVERMKMIDPLISKLLPHRPDFRELVVIGNRRPENDPQNGSVKPASPEVVATGGEMSAVDDTITERCITPRGVGDQTVDEEFGGPSLLFNEVLVPRLEKDKIYTYRIVPDPQSTLCFKASDENPVHQRILIKNNGTEDLTYQWKKVERKIFLGNLPQRDSPFYFFTNNGSIACGASKEVCISFQSSCEGVFSETWYFITEPPLLPSTTPIALHLFGIAFWPDSRLNGKSEIFDEIQRQITKEMIKEMVEDCLASIYWARARETRIVGPPTEVYLCEKQNPYFKFSSEAVNALIALRSEGLIPTFRSPKWDYSLDTLRQEIIDMHTEGHIEPADADTLLQRLYNIVGGLAFPSLVTTSSSAEHQYRLCSSVVVDCLLRAFEACSALRLKMGLDTLPGVPDLICPWRQTKTIRANINSSNQLAKAFWRLIRIHLKKLTAKISKEVDSAPQISKPRLRERIGDEESWRASARVITRYLLGDLAEEIVTMIESNCGEN